MDIIPVIDILNNQVVKAIKGNRNSYKSINYKLYNSTEPRDIIYQIVNRYKPKTIYIADLSAILMHKIDKNLYKSIFEAFPKINFWVDSGKCKISLTRKHINYYPVICSESSTRFSPTSNKSHKCIYSFDSWPSVRWSGPLLPRRKALCHDVWDKSNGNHTGCEESIGK